MFPDTNKVKKTLVSLALEESLLEIGGSKLLHDVFRILYEKFQSYLPDCYDHPEYLRGIFAEIDSGTCDVLLESLNEKLEEYAYQKSIGEFLVKISKMKCRVS
ncbi:MAG: hypothetical protein HY222_07740 [Thaumarchaeota archaeon]|nr:hypothetical protein [Nitrososphaerota archaeon]MBI3642266.1 hypothetical protein [Nitrososphaerota archaeon]